MPRHCFPAALCLFLVSACQVVGQEAAKADEKSNTAAKTIAVKVVDPEDKPIVDAKIHVAMWAKPMGGNRDFQTYAEGKAIIDLPQERNSTFFGFGQRSQAMLASLPTGTGTCRPMAT